MAAAGDEASRDGVTAAEVLHAGGCHCGAVRFTARAPARLTVWKCNCSICAKRQNDHFVVPSSKFEIAAGEDKLTTYTFGTHVAKHMFCSVCGVQAFYRPRSNPDGWGVTIHCVDPGTVESVDVRAFDGRNWEKFIEGSGIRGMSKDGDA